jgi:hypothetical protein
VTSGRFSELSKVPAYQIRGYLSGLAAQITAECPGLVAPPKISENGRRVVEYMLPPPNNGTADLAHTYAWAAKVAENKQFFEVTSNTQAGGSKWVKAFGCSTPEFSKLKSYMDRLSSDATLAGSIEPEVQKACTTLTAGRDDCGCFVNAVDMQSTPAHRARFLASENKPGALQTLLQEQYFATGIVVKCRRIPNFGYSLGAAQLRSSETKSLSLVLMGWHTGSNTSYRDTAVIAQQNKAVQYARTAERSRRRAVEVLICSYGPPSGIEPSHGKDPNVRYYWRDAPIGSKADLQRALGDYQFLDKLTAMGESPVTACPESLGASPSTASVHSAEPTPVRDPPRVPASNDRCPRLLARLQESRELALRGSYPANALRRQEMTYATHCGAAPR